MSGGEGTLFGRIRRVAALLADPRTPRLPRFSVLLAVLYFLWPIDIVPEWVFPIVGYFDDLTVLWLSLRWLLKSGAALPSAQRGEK